MLFKNTKIPRLDIILLIISLIVVICSLFFTVNSINKASMTNQNVFSYSIKVRSAVEELDKTLESAEINTNVLADSISNSYDASKQQNEAYNMQFIKNIDGLIKAVLGNSPGVDGSWFQLNADLPFAIHAYNWYGFRDDEFVNLRNQFISDPSLDRKITPEDDPYYFNAVNNKKATWSDVYTDPDTKKEMITISNPIYKDGALVGVVGIDISMNNLNEALDNMKLMLGDSELFLLNTNNKLIISRAPNNSEISKNNDKFIELFKRHKYQPVEYYDYLTKKIAIMITLSNHYEMIIVFDYNNLMGNLSNLFNVIYVLYAITIVLILILIKNALIKPKSVIKNEVQQENSDSVENETESINN